MKAKTILDAEKKDAIDIATELCYSEEVKRKIAQAKYHSFDCRRNSGNNSDEAYGGRKC